MANKDIINIVLLDQAKEGASNVASFVPQWPTRKLHKQGTKAATLYNGCTHKN